MASSIGPPRADAGVVADDVHAAEIVTHAASHVLDLRGIAHIAPIGTHVDIGRVELRVGLGQRLVLDVDHGNVHAGPGEGPRHAETDTGRRAGHHGDLVLNGFHRHTPRKKQILVLGAWQSAALSAGRIRAANSRGDRGAVASLLSA